MIRASKSNCVVANGECGAKSRPHRAVENDGDRCGNQLDSNDIDFTPTQLWKGSI